MDLQDSSFPSPRFYGLGDFGSDLYLEWKNGFKKIPPATNLDQLEDQVELNFVYAAPNEVERSCEPKESQETV
jgi:hypothetical protein